eukprot:TRINITY_DN19500_c0_g1_i3.p1 TRINITY_DN19500_c0_g1~~TRINITY_DN19500_c0_g1_i3.p1  ORF type:complete len:171 (+),score=20.71 TRINITY_DN19500_c0_g1_i3:131-643(+)
MSPPQLSVGWPVDFGADIPVFPPFAAISTLLLSFACAYVFGRLKVLPKWSQSAAIRVAYLAVLVGAFFSVTKGAGGELKAAGSGTLFTPVGGLATTGPYEYTRNPMYSVLIFVAFPAAVLIFDTLWPVLVSPLLYCYIRYIVVAREEVLLQKEFGQPYLDFCEKVPRFLL